MCHSSFRDLPTATDALVAAAFWKHEYVKVAINNAAWEVVNMHGGVTRMPAEESIQEARDLMEETILLQKHQELEEELRPMSASFSMITKPHSSSILSKILPRPPPTPPKDEARTPQPSPKPKTLKEEARTPPPSPKPKIPKEEAHTPPPSPKPKTPKNEALKESPKEKAEPTAAEPQKEGLGTPRAADPPSPKTAKELLLEQQPLLLPPEEVIQPNVKPNKERGDEKVNMVGRSCLTLSVSFVFLAHLIFFMHGVNIYISDRLNLRLRRRTRTTLGVRKRVKKTMMRCVLNEFVFNDNAMSTLQNDGTTPTIHLLQCDSSGSSSNDDNDDDNDESGPEEELDAEVMLKCKEEMRQRCVTDCNDEFNIAERVMGWETSSKFSTEPSRLEPVHRADDVDSDTANTLHRLSPYKDILVACGEDILPAQVVMTTSFGILVKYYTSYKINATDLRYKIVGQTTPYKVDYTEFIGKLDRLGK